MNLGEKLKMLRKRKGITQIEFARLFNISNGAIALWETNRRQPDYEMLNRISNYFNVSIDFLLNENQDTPTQQKRTGVKIPVLGSVPGGIPLEAIEDIIDYEEISTEMASKGEFFCLKVKGTSMSPTICDGDIVIFKRQETADSGDICVVMINGYDATLKEIKRDINGLYVIPKNPDSDFKPTFFTNREVEELPVRILGVAVEIRRTLKK